MTLYYCYVCEQRVNAIDVIKSSLVEAKDEQKEPLDTSHPHHQLECEQCHQSYIEEVEPPQPATTAAATPATAPPSSSPFPQSAELPASGQPQLAAQMFQGPPIFNFFASPPFPPASAGFPLPFPLSLPFPGAQPGAHFNGVDINNQPLTGAVPTGAPTALPPFPFPFSAFPFPFSAFPQPATANGHPAAFHPGNYAVNNTHFNQLLSSFLHPIQSRHRGLDPALLARLNRRTVGSGSERREACVVCQCDTLGGEEVVVLPGCGHCFHVACIEPWLKEHDLCPTCRKQVTAADFLSGQTSATEIDNVTSGGSGSGDTGRDGESASAGSSQTTAPDAAR